MRNLLKHQPAYLGALILKTDTALEYVPPPKRVSDRVARQRHEAAGRKAARDSLKADRELQRYTRKLDRAGKQRQAVLRVGRRYEWFKARIGTDPIGDARRLIAARKVMRDADAVTVCFGLLAVVCRSMRLSLDATLRHIAHVNARTADPDWLAAARARQLAAYVAHASAGIEQAAIARAFNLHRNSVKRFCADIRARARGDAQLGAAIAAAASAVLAPTGVQG